MCVRITRTTYYTTLLLYTVYGYFCKLNLPNFVFLCSFFFPLGFSCFNRLPTTIKKKRKNVTAKKNPPKKQVRTHLFTSRCWQLLLHGKVDGYDRTGELHVLLYAAAALARALRALRHTAVEVESIRSTRCTAHSRPQQTIYMAWGDGTGVPCCCCNLSLRPRTYTYRRGVRTRIDIATAVLVHTYRTSYLVHSYYATYSRERALTTNEPNANK